MNSNNNITIKRIIQEEYVTIVNTQEPNIGAPQYVRQMIKDITGEGIGNTLVPEDFNTPCSLKDTSFRQKVNTETQALNDTLDLMDLVDIYR